LVLRTTTVYAQSEPRDLAEAPYGADVGGGTVPETIELDQLYDGLQSGRWAILSGERTDVLDANGQPISGVMASELVMLAGVTQEVQRIPTGQKDQSGTPVMIALPGDKTHTFVHLARPLAYRYERASVTINGNVARATHGETRSEVLGSGDGSKALQQFALRQSPLTFISVPTPAGAESTLQVRVNDLLWHEAESLFGLQPTDRSYTTKTDDTDKTTVIFGNGQYGARLPTGVENVKATYRTGIGKAGNVQAGQITLLATRPLGVKSVNNPLRASGGADKETRDQARRNVPLAFMALDRLVSLRDYADFARTYAGIGKAAVARLSDGRRQLVHLTIAGAENIPIDPTSDLYLNLFQALRQFGDPSEPVQLALAEVMFLIVSAKVRVQPDSLWEAVEARIRAALLDTFSFERRDLGQPVFQSEVLSAIQGVAGVEYVDLEILDAVDQERVIRALDNPQQGGDQSDTLVSSLKLGNGDVPVRLAQVADQSVHGQPKPILPAQLAFLTPDVPDTLILKELTP
jgi:predicted phage baseplate assembly protein